MVKAKHFMETLEADDGLRAWVEPIGLTKDLQEWCSVDEVLLILGPPRGLSEWFEAHPGEYEEFRGRYHRWLSASPYRPSLEKIARNSSSADVTFLHASDDADHNCASALKEFIAELAASCSPED